jgi:hypothetical protein
LKKTSNFRRSAVGGRFEAKILLSIAFWKRGRGYQTEALGLMAEAIRSANGYGYTQVFANEGAELVNMLQRLVKAASQKDCSGELPAAFVKTLYIKTLDVSSGVDAMIKIRELGLLETEALNA